MFYCFKVCVIVKIREYYIIDALDACEIFTWSVNRYGYGSTGSLQYSVCVVLTLLGVVYNL